MSRREKLFVAGCVVVALWPLWIVLAIAYNDFRDWLAGRPGGNNLL